MERLATEPQTFRELVEADLQWAARLVIIAATEPYACQTRINRSPRPWGAENFRSIEWLPESSIDPALIGLLPTAPRPMTPKEVSACNTWFGVAGRFPSVKIAAGEVGI